VRGAGKVLLLWARDGAGAKVRADRLAPADRRGRGPFRCLGCGEQLVPRLGEVRARHFAHLPGSRCPLTAPETILHLDAKERLLALCSAAFEGRLAVTLLARCGRCRGRLPVDLGSAGDAAEPEGAVGPLRADVLVRARGVPALALEVRVTHAVAAEKEAALAGARLPFVEVDAREEWERAEGGKVEVSCARCGGFPPCPACAALARADADRAAGGEAAEIADLEEYRARGLFGATAALAPPPGAGPAEGEPLSPAERADLARRFECPECGTRSLDFGVRLARHRCARAGVRPVAWRGYGGGLVALSWWRRRGDATPR
jgi:hypothetical protein